MDSTIERHSARFPRTQRHPLVGAVLLAVLGGVLTGCASSGPVQGDAAVRDAQSAYARKEYKKAAELLAVPAMQGNVDAQYALGYLYYYGRGVRKDQRRARAWFEDAARLGHPGARQALQLLTVYAQMPPLPGENAPGKRADDVPSLSEPAANTPADMGETGTESLPPPAEMTGAPAPQAPAAAVPAEAVAPPAAPNADTAAPAAPAPSAPAPAARSMHSAEAGTAPVTVVKASWRESSAPSMPHTTLAAVEDAVSSVAPPRYTVHLLSSRSRADLERLVQAHGLTDASYYAVDRLDGRHYRLIYGGFQTMAEARSALEALPRALRAHRPWVNNYPADITVSGIAAL